MNTQPPDVRKASVARVFHVSVTDDGIVEVDGGTPQEVIDLLQASGNQVVIVDGVMLTTAVPDPDAVENLHGLSERELQVLTLIATGLTNAEVAREAYLSVNTVKSYIRSAYRKMDVQSRSQAVIWAIDHGVVAAHPNRD